MAGKVGNIPCGVSDWEGSEGGVSYDLIAFIVSLKAAWVTSDRPTINH